MRRLIAITLSLAAAGCAESAPSLRSTALSANVVVTKDEPPHACRLVDDDVSSWAMTHDEAVDKLRAAAARLGGDWVTLDGRTRGDDIVGVAGMNLIGRAYRCFMPENDRDPEIARVRPTTRVAAGDVIVDGSAPHGCAELAVVPAADRGATPSYVRAVAGVRDEARRRGANWAQLGAVAHPSASELTVEVRLFACPASSLTVGQR
jgi:hypothetical protein